jgi:CDP-paratose 2-epimerase
MRILITGICGFVGSSIATHISENYPGADIFGIDSFVRSGSEQNRSRLNRLGIRVIHGDLRVPGDVHRLPDADLVIDAAANASVLAGKNGDDARDLFDTNLVGTLNVLEYCRESGAGLVLLSTSRVYSQLALENIPLIETASRFAIDPTKALPNGVTRFGIAEEFSTAAPVSLYGASKLASEAIAFEYGCAFDFPVWVNRCGVLAGSGQFGVASQGIFAYWINRYLHRLPLRYTGFDGRGFQVRDILHPVDLAELIMKQVAQPKTAGCIYNVGGGEPNAMSLFELSQWCKERFGEHKIQSDSGSRPYDVPWVVIDGRIVQKTYDWAPRLGATCILDEIAKHAVANENWLEISAA